MADEDYDVLAAEYVLGTLTAEERASVEQLAAKDSGFAGRIAGWERRLGALEEMVEPVEPPAEIWNRIRERIAETNPEAALRLPEIIAAPTAREPESTASNVVVLRQRVRRWRAVAGLVGAAAAAVLLVVGLGRYRPELLPLQLQPPVQIRVVEKPVDRIVEKVVEKIVEVPRPAPAPARFVAVLQRDAGAPAFLLTVDVGNRTLTVRRVSAALEAGKSHELWLVSDKFPAPRSLGVVEPGQFTSRPALASYDAQTINDATYAVSLEPVGGSPTGVPTGPVLFTGKLVEAVPPR